MNVSVCQLGARMQYQVARSLNRRGWLSYLYTDFTSDRFPWNLILKTMAFSGWESAKRLYLRKALLDSKKIIQFPYFGWQYYRKQAVSYNFIQDLENYLWAEEEFANNIIKHLENDPADILYVFNTAALTLMVNNSNRKIVLEQCSLPYGEYFKRIKKAEQEYPEWTKNIDLSDKSNEVIKRYTDREKKELQSSDCIIVPSEHVKTILIEQGANAEKIRLVPYGYNFNSQTSVRVLDRPMSVATIGMLDIRKGIQHFYNVAKNYRYAKFFAIGQIGNNISESMHNELTKYVHCTGHLDRLKLEEKLKTIDVLLFLSLGEGSATVTYEALSMGIPVITTAEAGSIVEDKISGFIVKADDYNQIIQCLNALSDAKFYSAMSYQALERSKFGSSKAYEERILNCLQSVK